MLTTGEMSIPAIIGFISLFGISTRTMLLIVTIIPCVKNREWDCVKALSMALWIV